jgi:nucleoid-associated protein YgaU
MKQKVWKAITIGGCTGLMLSLAACSSSNPSLDQAQSLDEIPSLDAGTDAVPVDGLQADMDGLQTDEGAQTAPTDESTAEPSDQAVAQPESAPVAGDPATTEQTASDTAQTASTETVAPDTAVAQPDPGSSGATQEYSVQQGDTLMKIAFDTYGDLYQWKKIYEMNKEKITDPNALPAGLTLTIEQPSGPVAIQRNGEKYLIKPGDTLGTISGDVYGTNQKWRKLWENNKQLIKDPNRIFAGFYLYYTMTPEERDEAQKLKQQRELAPQPLAQTQDPMQPVQQPQAQAPAQDMGTTSMAQQPGADTRAPATADPGMQQQSMAPVGAGQTTPPAEMNQGG